MIMRGFSKCFLSCSTSLLHDIVYGTLAYEMGHSWAGQLETTPPGLPIPPSRPGGSMKLSSMDQRQHEHPGIYLSPFPTQPGWGPALLVEILSRGPLAICLRVFLGVRSSLSPGVMNVPSWLQVCLVGWVLQTQLWTVVCRGVASGAGLLLCPLGSRVWLDAGAGQWQWVTCHSVLSP